MSSSCLLPFWVPRRQRQFISVFLKVTFAPAHTFCKYKARFHNGQGRGTGKSMCSETSGELFLQHCVEIHSVSWLIKLCTNSLLLSAAVFPFGLTVYLQENQIKCYLWEGLNPSPGLCVCAKVFFMLFSFMPLPFNIVLLATAQIWCFLWDYTACPEVQRFNLSNGTYKGKKWCNCRCR